MIVIKRKIYVWSVKMKNEINLYKKGGEDNLKFRKELYPRKFSGINQRKIEEYSENLELLPPIKINQKNEIINGVHRWYAHKKIKEQKTIKVIIVETKDDAELLKLSIEEDRASAMQMSPEDKKGWAVELTITALDNNETVSNLRENLTKQLSVTEDTYNKWTVDIRKEYNKQIKEQIIQEYLKAELTQKEVAEKFSVTKMCISRYIDDCNRKINLLFSYKPHDLFNNYDKETKDKLLKEYYDDKEDKRDFMDKKLDFETFFKRLKEENEYISKFMLTKKDGGKLEMFNIWNQSKIDNETTHFGNIPRKYNDNLLYYYTEPFDIVYDPFAGGGPNIDVCKLWYRRYYCADRIPVESRPDIKKQDIKDGLPNDLPNNIKLVFLDPPYWKQAENQYSKDKEDLANMSLEKFYDSIMTFVKNVKKKLAKDGKIALIIQGSQWKNNLVLEDHAFEIAKQMDKLGFKIQQRIICPYATEQYNAQQVIKAKEEKICLQTYRDLMVFELK